MPKIEWVPITLTTLRWMRLDTLLGAVAVAAALHQLYKVHYDRVLD